VQPAEVAARVAIADLVARYNAQGDSGRFEQLLELFCDDAVMELEGTDGTVTTYEGTAAIATIFTGAATRWRDQAAARSARHYLRHFTSTHQIDLVDERHATGRCYFAVLMPHGLDHWGRYLDRYEARHGRWLFARRRAVTDGHAEGGGTAG